MSKVNKIQYISPLANLVMELNDQLLIATHIDKSTTALKATPTLLKTIKKFLDPEQHQELILGMNKIEKDSLQTIKDSKRILMDDFFKTNQHIFTSMWNSLQTAIENTLTELLKKEDVRNDIFNSDIPNKLKDMLRDKTDEDNYRWFLSKWQTKGNNKTEYTESKLLYFDLGGNISEDLKTGLLR